MYVEGKYVSCICSACKEAGCRLDLTGLADRVVVLDMNRVKDVGDRPCDICDCGVLFKREAVIASVELKGGRRADVSKLAEQIQRGMDALSEIVDDQHVSYFYPILMYRTRSV